MDRQADLGVSVPCLQDLNAGDRCRVPVMAEESSRLFMAELAPLLIHFLNMVYGDLPADPRSLLERLKCPV